MPYGPAVPIMGIQLRREGNYAIVSVEFPDGKSHDVIKELYDGNFCHHITTWFAWLL